MKTINRQELERKIRNPSGMTLINTLPEDNFEDTKIPGAINIPQNDADFVDQVSAVVRNNKDAEIVVYCASMECDSSTQAANKLEEAGFTNVYDYEGGAKDWKEGSTSPMQSSHASGYTDSSERADMAHGKSAAHRYASDQEGPPRHRGDWGRASERDDAEHHQESQHPAKNDMEPERATPHKPGALPHGAQKK